jgi:isomaltose glucohydrolase
VDLLSRSVEIMLAGQDPSGAFVASPTFPVYRYSWIQDGAFIAAALDTVGEHAAARAFHRWIAAVVLRERGKIERLARDIPERPGDDRILHARYQVDGTPAALPWSNFQLHGYGMWLSSLATHLSGMGEEPAGFDEPIRLVARYLGLLWNHPCYDCWEERWGRHPATIAAIARGLTAAARTLGDDGLADPVPAMKTWLEERGTAGGALARSEDGHGADASALFVLGPFGPFDAGSAVARRTLDRVEASLGGEAGGVHRHADDSFYGGGLWLPCAGALSLAYTASGETERAGAVLEWIEAAATEDGSLPEQVPRDLLRPEELPRWEGRWGPIATPLLWSHAMYVLARVALRGSRSL